MFKNFILAIHNLFLLVIWLVILILLAFSLLGAQNTERIPSGWQNFMEATLEFVVDIAKNQLGESFYREWIPFIGTLFLFIFGCNWAGAIIPWKLIALPEGELGAPTNDINTTAALALLTSAAYFYAGFSKKGLGYFKRYIFHFSFYQLMFWKILNHYHASIIKMFLQMN